MHLSQIQLNPRRRETGALLSSPHRLHAAVLAAFPDPSPRVTGRVLWRLDSEEHRTLLRIVSPSAPDLTHIAEQAGWPTLAETWAVRPYGRVLDRIESGQVYGFRLTANPVRSRRLPPGERGKVYGHVTVAQQQQWLLDRQEQLGFRVATADFESDHIDVDAPTTPLSDDVPLALRITERRTLQFSRRETSVTLRVATYEGVLQVTDPSIFVHALSFGIGRGKGYGCGLMTIAPVR